MREADVPDIRNLTKPLIFVHIEKTAGTAFTEYLRACVHAGLKPAKTYMGGPPASYFEDPDERLYVGHISFDQCARFAPDAYYVTFLRHPRARALSQYRSWHNPQNLTPEWRAALTKSEIDAVLDVQNMSFRDYVLSDNPRIYKHINNLMCMRLARNPYESKDLAHDAYVALEENFHFFGLVERYQESLATMARAFKNLRVYKVEDRASNISVKYDGSLDYKAEKRLLELNEHDLVLYRKADLLFRARHHH